MSSVKEIARRLGLSTATISRAFDPRHAEKVRPETRERIYALCEQENFRPGIIGRCFTTGKTFKIGILIGADDDNSSSYWRQLFASVSNAVSSCGYVPLLLSISNWENAEKTMTEYFRSGLDIKLF